MARKLESACFFVLFGIVIGLAVHGMRLNSELFALRQIRGSVSADHGQLDALPGQLLPRVVLPNLSEAGSVGLPRLDSRPSLVILFSESDCYARLADVEDWAAWGKGLKDGIDVIGIFSGSSRSHARRFVQGQSLGIPVLFDMEGKMVHALALPEVGSTPVRLLVGGDGVILHAFNVTSDPLRKAAQRRLIASIGAIGAQRGTNLAARMRLRESRPLPHPRPRAPESRERGATLFDGKQSRRAGGATADRPAGMEAGARKAAGICLLADFGCQ